MKQKNKLKLFLAASLIFAGMLDVKAAADWTAGVGTKHGYSFSVGSMDLHAGGGNVFTLKNGSTGETRNEVYCIDPAMYEPVNMKYTKEEGDFEHKAEYTEICNLPGLTDKERIDVFKAYAFLNDDVGKIGDEGVYKNTYRVYDFVYNGKVYEGDFYINGSTVSNLEYGKKIKGIAQGITGKTVEAKPVIEGSNDGKVAQYILNTNGYKGKLTIKTDGKLNGNKVDGGVFVQNDFEGTLSIKIEASDGCSAGNTNNFSIEFEYSGAGSSSGKTAELYTNGNTQDLIACVPTGESTECTGSDCKVEKNGEVSCSGETCEDIEFQSNAGLCDDTGTTVVVITEKPSDLAYNSANCIQKLPDATKAMIGNNTNEYCKIYCSENYKLVLPGPDAKNGDDANVFVNAGTYFTIETNENNMYDETTFTCYGTINYDEYLIDVTNIRYEVVKKYNELSELKAKKEALKKAVQGESECEVSGKYRKLAMSANGSTKEEMANINFGLLTTCPSPSSLDSEITKAEQALNAAITTANQKMTDVKTDWNECINWDFTEFNKLLDQDDCHSNIDFTYQFDTCDAKINKVETKVVSTNEKKSSSATETLYTGICDVSGNLSSCNKSESVPSYTYINRQETIKTTYKFDNDYTINYTTGEISCDAKTGEEYSEVIHGFPVSIDAAQAKYRYEYNYSLIGHDFDAMNAGSCKMGRFDSIIGDKDNHGCYFDVNSCEDCDVECVDPTGKDCTIDFCDGACQVACVGGGCIIDINAGFLATYRTLSLNDPFPNSVAVLTSSPSPMLALASTKDAPASWTNWTTEKGTAAKAKIEDEGEKIYESKPQYSVTLTPQVISDIRKYNKEQNGDYLNSTLSCKDKLSKNYGQCVSSFIHEDDRKWKFEINSNIDPNQQIVDIDGIKVPFISYDDTLKSFVGPAWK